MKKVITTRPLEFVRAYQKAKTESLTSLLSEEPPADSIELLAALDYWIEQYLAWCAEEGNDTHRNDIEMLFGTTLGDCIIKDIGGEWQMGLYQDGKVPYKEAGIVTEKGTYFPLTRVRKILKGHIDDKDALLNFYLWAGQNEGKLIIKV